MDMIFKYSQIIATSLLLGMATAGMADTAVTDSLIKTYQAEGATTANAQQGEIFWNKTFSGKAPFTERSCKTCHSANLKNPGKHIRTGKVIKPLAPSVNPKRLTNPAKVKKWLKRNCKWTTGKECSAQQKADILAFIQQQ